jgi:endonuclease/exonuclease/phosphatase family metal-dependent hydrolase
MPTKENKKKRRNSLLSVLFLAANFVVLIFLALGFIAAYIPPDKYWIFAFAGLAFPYMALINVIFLIIWLVTRKMYFFISLAALLLCWSRISGFFQFSGNDSGYTTESSIKVVSYNVRIFDRYQWESKKISRNAEGILTLTNQLSPDILCLQEYHAGRKGKVNMEDSIIKYTGLKHSHIEFVRLNGKTKPFGIATFSRWPVVSSQTINFKGNTVNFCLINDIVCYGDTLRVFNIHLESIQLSNEDYLYVSDIANQAESKGLFSRNSRKIVSKFKNAFIARASQAREVAERIQTSPYPVIVCGDFNDTPSSYSYYTIAKDLSDAFKESGSGFGQTYAGILPSFRIDYILHGQEFNSTGFQRIREPLSDHYPVTAILNLQEKQFPE